jgi:CBS domain containing-hemolysin-like protein
MAAVVVPVIMTLAILILSEIIPKTLGANYWRLLTGFTVSALSYVIYALAPLVWLSQRITNFLKKDKERSVLSRGEFAAMAEVVAEEGVIQHQEYKIIKSLLRFNRICVKDVMTPRTVVVAADQNISMGELYEEIKSRPFTRIPVFDGSRDHSTGYVIRNDMLSNMLEGNSDKQIKEIARDLLVVSAGSPLPAVFSELLEKRQHIAMVVDSYGGMAGIITMEDVLETLLGLEIVDEFDQTVDMQKLAREIWEKRARKMGLDTN